MTDVLIGTGYAALAGAIYGVVGYFKNKKQEDYFKGFNAVDFAVSVLGSAVIGGIASYMGLSPTEVAAGPIGVFVYQFVRKLIKAI